MRQHLQFYNPVYRVFRTRDTMHAILFLSHLSAIAIEQIHVIVIGFVILFTIRIGLAQDYITLFRTDSREIIYPEII